MWWNGVGQYRATDEEHDKYCVEEGFQLASVKLDGHGEGGSEAYYLNIWDESEQELGWFKKSSSHFENNFPIFLLSGISDTSIIKMRDVLHWVNFLSVKTFSNIFGSTFYWGR